MSKKGVKKCEYCTTEFSRYPVKTADRLKDGKPCCAECERDLKKRGSYAL